MEISSNNEEGTGFSLERDREKRISLCERSLSTYSPSGSEGDLADLLFEELQSQGLGPTRDDAGNVLCAAGSGRRTLLFCGHMDTVPGEIPVRRDGNMLYGRGACDAKGALMSMLFAFEDIARKVKESGKVIFAAVTEEERSSRGLNELIRNNVLADGAVFGEPCGASKLTVGYRGHVPVTVEIRTRQAHGSAPMLASNSAEIAFSIYLKAKGLFPSNGRSDTGSVSVALTQIHSGSSHNVAPGKASMTLDIRVPYGLRTEEVAAKIRDLVSNENKDGVQASVTIAETTEPYRAELNSNLVRAFNRTLIKSGFSRPELVTKSGTGDMNTYALTFGVDAITYGPGDTKLSHTDEEKIDIEEIFSCSKILSSSVFEFFSLFERNQ